MALFCTDYKILSKVLSNRLKIISEMLISADQSYCVPDRSVLDNLFLMRDVFVICELYDMLVSYPLAKRRLLNMLIMLFFFLHCRLLVLGRDSCPG